MFVMLTGSGFFTAIKETQAAIFCHHAQQGIKIS